MKFTCLQENLAKGLQIVSKAIPTKSALPILSNVLLSAEGGRLKLTATNLETYITTFINASVEEEGSITIPSKTLKDYLANLSPNTLTVNLKDETLFITSDKTKSKFNGITAKEYPELPAAKFGEKFIALDPKVFSAAIALVGFASGVDESRPIFTGVYLKYTGGMLTIASTDGFRLSEKVLSVNTELADFDTIIPSKTVVEVARIFGNSSEPLKFALSEDGNLALFESEDTFVATRVLDGQYPDYKRIIPSQHVVKVTFNSSDFHEAVRLTAIFSKESSKDTSSSIKLRIDPEFGIKVTSLATEAGEHESIVAAEIEGDMVELVFSSRYLLDALSNVKAEKYILQTNSSSSPCLLKPVELEDFVHIIMPIQL